MDSRRKDHLLKVYRDGLLEDTLPFWFPRCVDEEFGGFFGSFDRDGTLVDTDKSVWQQGRTTWMLATLYSTIDEHPQREQWLDWARQGANFLKGHCFDTDGRMFFHVNREGEPIRKRRYVFSEAFACIAFAALARATGEAHFATRARSIFHLIIRHYENPSLFEPKFTGTRPTKGLGLPMILMATAQVLRVCLGEDVVTLIDRIVEEIRIDFLNEDYQAVMETVGIHGELIDHFDGRTLNPGHAIECAWFILHEAKHRDNDRELIALGTRMLNWMWKIGWDNEFGGILYFRDVKGLPVQEYWHDMKFWWPQNEAIIANLLAYRLTGSERFSQHHALVHDYAHRHFADPEHGEWFGYLHRDNRLSSSLKGNLWKGFFHLPRMQWYCWKLLEEES